MSPYFVQGARFWHHRFVVNKKMCQEKSSRLCCFTTTPSSLAPWHDTERAVSYRRRIRGVCEGAGIERRLHGCKAVPSYSIHPAPLALPGMGRSMSVTYSPSVLTGCSLHQAEGQKLLTVTHFCWLWDAECHSFKEEPPAGYLSLWATGRVSLLRVL